MKELTFTYAELCEQIEWANGKIIKPFKLTYPTDPRCRFTLRVWVETERADFRWYQADDAEVVSRLLGMEVVAFEWHQYSDKILKVVVRA